MPKEVAQEELEQILNAIREAGREGISAERIEAKLGLPITKRTLQRRLSRLEEEGLIEPVGAKSVRRYRVGRASTEVPFTRGGEDMGYVPISTEAENIRSEVRRPIHL